MKRFSFISALLFLACSFLTCTKYPEGPYVSIYGRELRVDRGWDVQKYLIDDIDSTHSKFFPCENYVHFSATGHGLVSHPFGWSCMHDTILSGEDGFWEFTDRKNYLTIYGSPVQGSADTTRRVFCLVQDGGTDWEILKLSRKEMHLQTNFNSKHYEIYLTSKDK